MESRLKGYCEKIRFGKRLLLTADLHLDNEDRFGGVDETGMTERLKEKIVMLRRIDVLAHENDATLVICGDITDRKDRLPGVVLNAFFDFVRTRLSEQLVVILGQHDFAVRDNPSIRVIDALPGVRVVSDVMGFQSSGQLVYAMAYQSTLSSLVSHLEFIRSQLTGGDGILLMHQPVAGVMIGMSHKLSSGADVALFREFSVVYSGDIHLTQKIGPIQYIGSPWQNNFGEEDYPNQVMLVDLETSCFTSISIANARFKTIDINVIKEDKDGVRRCLEAESWDTSVRYVKIRVKLTPEQHVALDVEALRSWVIENNWARGVLFEWDFVRQERRVVVSEKHDSAEAVVNYMAIISDEELGGLVREEVEATGRRFLEEVS